MSRKVTKFIGTLGLEAPEESPPLRHTKVRDPARDGLYVRRRDNRGGFAEVPHNPEGEETPDGDISGGSE